MLILARLDDDEHALDACIKSLAIRWLLVRNAHAEPSVGFLCPRMGISLMRGPMTRNELVSATAMHAPQEGNSNVAEVLAPTQDLPR